MQQSMQMYPLNLQMQMPMAYQPQTSFMQMQKAHADYCKFDDQQFATDPLVLALTFPDQCEFLRLSAYFKFASERNKRNMAISTFQKHLKLIQNFVCRGDYMDFDRGLACGVQFGPKYMLVNTKRLKNFMGRSKSCLNGCFHKCGYGVARVSSDDNQIITEFSRRFGRPLPQPRQWCIRSDDPSVTTAHSQIQSDAEIDIEPMESILDIRNLLNRKAESI